MTVEVVEAHIKGLISEGKLHYSSASGGKSGSPAPTIADRRISLSWALAAVEAWAGPQVILPRLSISDVRYRG